MRKFISAAGHEIGLHDVHEREPTVSEPHMFTVQVWFATSFDYCDVGKTADESVAMREARSYDSDSRGVRVVCPDGQVRQIKQERA